MFAFSNVLANKGFFGEILREFCGMRASLAAGTRERASRVQHALLRWRRAAPAIAHAGREVQRPGGGYDPGGFDLAWRLSWVRRGWADPSLLDEWSDGPLRSVQPFFRGMGCNRRIRHRPPRVV